MAIRHPSAALAESLQQRIESYYGLERAPSVASFLREPERGERESVRIRQASDGALEIEVLAPVLGDDSDLDSLCQLIEGVSHFLYVAERARRELPATELELELQAEIDKYLLLAWLQLPGLGPTRDRKSSADSAKDDLHRRLFEEVRFVHSEGTLLGDRYRLASGLAARYVLRLENAYVRRRRFCALQRALSRFYQLGQSGKIEVASAA